MMAVLALAVPASIFAYRGMFGGYMFTALPTSLKAGSHPSNIVENSSDETSVTSAGSSEKLQPIDIRGSPKPVPRVIFTIPISSRSGAGAQAPAPTASTLGPAVASSPDPQVAPPPASAPVPIPASPEPKETGATVPPAREQVSSLPGFAPSVLTAESVLPRASALVPVPASSEPTETAAVSAAPTPPLGLLMTGAASVPPACLSSAAITGFSGAEGGRSDRAGYARAGFVNARSCPDGAYGRICPTACLGAAASTLGAEGGWCGRAG